MSPPASWPIRAVLLGILSLLSTALVLPSRAAVPQGLDAPVRVESGSTLIGTQVSGYIDIPPAGTTRLGFTASRQARLVLDGRVLVESTGGGDAVSPEVIQPGPHRVHVQFADGPAPRLRWQRFEGTWAWVPRVVLSPRRLRPPAWTIRRLLKPAALIIALSWMALGWALVVAALRPAMARLVPEVDQRRALLAVAACCLLTYAYPAWWGLPAGWAQDEVVPLGVEGLAAFASPDRFEKYPPLLTYLMALLQLPILLASSLDLLATDDELVYAVMRATGRLLLSAMAAGAVVAVYVCARRAASHRVAIWTAVIAGLSVPLAYYGKTSNPDVPYVFWFMLAFVAYQSALLDGGVRSYLAFAAAAAAAVTTKDQAYGLFVLPIIHLLWTRIRQVRSRAGTFGALWRDPALPGALAVGLLTFAVIHHLPRNWPGMMGHFRMLTGVASQGYRMVDSTSMSGQAWLFRRTLHQIGWAFGWPAATLVGLGVALALRSARQLGSRLVPFVVPAASYYLSFIAVVGYTYDRFVIPLCLLLAIFAGIAVVWLQDAAGERGMRARVARAAPVAVAAYMAGRMLSVDLLMASDSRQEVRRFMLSTLPAGSVVCYVEDPEMLPFLGGFNTVRAFSSSCGAVIVTSKFPERYPAGAPARIWYDELMQGRLGYRVALEIGGGARGLLQYEREMRNPDPSFSVLHKVNPRVTLLLPASSI